MVDGVGCFGMTQKNDEKKLKKQRLRNCKILLGDIKKINPTVRRFYELALPENLSQCGKFFAAFEATPEKIDELRFEKQTFSQWKVQREFQKLHYHQRIRAKRKKIYILPIGPFPSFVLEKIPGLKTSLFKLLSNFISVFYLGYSVAVLDVVDLKEISCRTRVHPGTGKLQILVTDILLYLKEQLPKDGFCIVGISWEDLYPGNDWNFVLGESSCEDGCAAISFGHHEPKGSEKLSLLNSHTSKNNDALEVREQIAACSKKDSSYPSESQQLKEYSRLKADKDGGMKMIDGDDNKLLYSTGEILTQNFPSENDVIANDIGLDVETSGGAKCGHFGSKHKRIDRIDASEIWKFYRVFSHELGHVFGITHCSYFTCAMNESTSIDEAVNQPLFMCPVCLRKIQKGTGFDVIDRYARLRYFLETLHSDLVQEQSTGKHDNCDNEIESTVCEDSNRKALERISKSVSWMDLVLDFLGNE